MQNSDESKILLTLFCRKIRRIIINDYETINDEYANIND